MKIVNKIWTSFILAVVMVCSTVAQADNGFSMSTNGMEYSWKAYPGTATKDNAVLLIERLVPKQVSPNKVYTFEVKVSNRSFTKLDQVLLTETLPDGFTLVKTYPAAETRNKVLKWDLGMMAPGQVDVITITGKAEATGMLYHRGNAEFNSDLGSMHVITEVVEPVLQFRIIAASEVILGDKLPVKVQFRNGGNAPVLDAKLDHTFAKGLVPSTGKRNVLISIGNIQPNEVKTFDFLLDTKAVGKFDNTLIARARDGVKASAMMKTSILQPVIKITTKAPAKRFVGNVIKYETKLVNTGNAVARDVALKLPIPQGVKFVKADEGGLLKSNAVQWSLGTLQPGEEKVVRTHLVADRIMIVHADYEAKAVGAETAVSKQVTNVAGIPAILLKMNDVNDPVPVGEMETYVIDIENQGSLAATGVVARCILEDSMAFVKSEGPVKSSIKGNIVTFKTIESIQPNKVVTLKVIVKAVKAGDVRCRVEINSNELTRPVKEDESTNFYE